MMRPLAILLSLVTSAAPVLAQSNSDVCELFGICEVYEYQQVTDAECQQLVGQPVFTGNPRIGDICSRFQLVLDENLVSAEKSLHFLAKRPTLVLDKLGAFVQLDMRPGLEKMRMLLNVGRMTPEATLELKNIIPSLHDGIERPLPYIGKPRQSIQVRLLVERRLYEIGAELGVIQPVQSAVFRDIRVENYKDVDLVQVSASLTPYGAQIFDRAWSRGQSLAHVISLQIEHGFASNSAPVRFAATGTLPCLKNGPESATKSFVPCP